MKFVDTLDIDIETTSTDTTKMPGIFQVSFLHTEASESEFIVKLLSNREVHEAFETVKLMPVCNTFLNVNSQPNMKLDKQADVLEFHIVQGSAELYNASLFTTEHYPNILSRTHANIANVTKEFNPEIWANSPEFDCAILEKQWAHMCLNPPWKYNMKRDIRTMTKFYESVVDEADVKEMWKWVNEFEPAHDARVDVKRQLFRRLWIYSKTRPV